MTREGLVEIAPGLLRPDWDLPAGVGALLTTRAGGQSVGPFASFNLGGHVGDDPLAVAANRARLRGFVPADPLWLSQVHGAAVANADVSEGVPEAAAVLDGFARQALHAFRLGLVHPQTGVAMEWTAPMAADFAALLDELRRQKAGGRP